MNHKTASLPISHLLLAIAVMAMWGSNFVVMKFVLDTLPPLLFAALRFMLAFLPAAFFIRRPNVPLTQLAAYGLLIGAGQFGLLYIAIRHDISPGLASLVIQMQVFFTIGLSIWLRKEQVRRFQWLALLLSTIGLAIIALHHGENVTLFGLTLVLLAALSWAGGNMVAKAAINANMLAYVVWGSFFAFPPLFGLSFLFEGWQATQEALAQSGGLIWAAILYQSFANTLFGYAAWFWLLARHPAAAVAPLALLVPVFGMSASALFLSEPLQGWKLGAAALVMGGLALNVLWPKVEARRQAWRAKAELLPPAG